MINLEGFEGIVENQYEDDILIELRSKEGFELPPDITDADLWANYTDERLYLLDKKVREYFFATKYKRQYQEKEFRTSVPLVFACIFGRKPEAKDSQYCVLMHKLLTYYAKRKTGQNNINGKKFTNVYYIGPYQLLHRRPYSLRLRLEEMDDSKQNRTIWSGYKQSSPRKKKP
jgi:hypothetical protein